MKRYLSDVLVLILLAARVISTSARNDCHGLSRGSILDARDRRAIAPSSSSSSPSSLASLSLRRAPLPKSMPSLPHQVPRGGGFGGSKNKLASSKPERAPKAQVAALAAATVTPTVSPLVLRLKIGFYFGLWYALNIYYNSYVTFVRQPMTRLVWLASLGAKNLSLFVIFSPTFLQS